VSAERLDELSVDDFDDSPDLTVAASPVSRIARGTSSMQDAVAQAIETGRAEVLREDGSVRTVISIPPAEPVDVTGAQLHAALTVVRDLLSCIDTKADMWQSQQDAIWRARELLKEHSVAVKS